MRDNPDPNTNINYSVDNVLMPIVGVICVLYCLWKKGYFDRSNNRSQAIPLTENPAEKQPNNLQRIREQIMSNLFNIKRYFPKISSNPWSYFNSQSSGYNSALLLQSIAAYKSEFEHVSTIYKQQNNEVSQLIKKQEVSLTEEQQSLLTTWQRSSNALFEHCKQKPVISENITSQHEAEMEIKELDQYVITLNRLLDICSTDHQQLINELQLKSSMLLTRW